MCSRFRNLAAVMPAIALLSCQSSADRTSPAGPGAELTQGNRLSALQPGQPTVTRIEDNPVEPSEEVIAQGKQLYSQFSCSGCHAAGGGAIGPALMDDEWIYGSSPANIFWTVIEGRPQGMPAFGGRIQQDQLWRIVAYVRSLSGLHKQLKEMDEQPQAQPVGK